MTCSFYFLYHYMQTKGVNPGGDGGDVSPPCFEPQICWVFLFWKINNVL